MDDQTLARRALRGDDQAFSELFDIYFPRLFRFALRRVADEDAAEDIVQSTLIKALGSLASWRGEASLFTWLCTICRREVHDHWQRLGRHPDVASMDEAPDVRAALEALSAGNTLLRLEPPRWWTDGPLYEYAHEAVGEIAV